MNGLGVAFLAIAGALILTLPRPLASLPLLASALYMTGAQVLEVGPANFTVPRLLVALGFVRVLVRGEHLVDGLHTVDRVILLWAAVLLGMSAFHTSDAWLYRSGLVWTEVGCYFLFRIFMTDIGDVRTVSRFVCIAIAPVALLLLLEKASGHNPFAVLGGFNATALVRDGHVRATGPFAHPIFAGIVGALGIGLGFALRKRHALASLTGILAGSAMIYAANSSGPILMVVFIVLARWLWLLRDHMRTVRRASVLGLLALSVAMNDPFYFLMSRIDISGGSQGYFRAQLIRSSIEHLGEWWAVGTDYTRHWMATGIYANARHTDITNHYLAMGVLGGLPLMVIFVALLALSFRDIGRALEQRTSGPVEDRLLIWSIGTLLFGFVMVFLSISMFDQVVIFYYLTLAAVQAAVRKTLPARAPISGGVPTRSRTAALPLRTPAR